MATCCGVTYILRQVLKQIRRPFKRRATKNKTKDLEERYNEHDTPITENRHDNTGSDVKYDELLKPTKENRQNTIDLEVTSDELKKPTTENRQNTREFTIKPDFDCNDIIGAEHRKMTENLTDIMQPFRTQTTLIKLFDEFLKIDDPGTRKYPETTHRFLEHFAVKFSFTPGAKIETGQVRTDFGNGKLDDVITSSYRCLIQADYYEFPHIGGGDQKKNEKELPPTDYDSRKIMTNHFQDLLHLQDLRLRLDNTYDDELIKEESGLTYTLKLSDKTILIYDIRSSLKNICIFYGNDMKNFNRNCFTAKNNTIGHVIQLVSNTISAVMTNMKFHSTSITDIIQS